MLVLYPSYSFETLSTDRDDAEANQLLSAWSALFHPALLEKATRIPRWESATGCSYEIDDDLVIVPPCCEELLPPDWIERQEKRGSTVFRNLADRDEMLDRFLPELGVADHGFDPEFVANFLALGTAYFLTDLLVRQLRYMSMLDDTKLAEQVFESIKAYRNGDTEKSTEQLKAAFESVSESKEYFYPTQSYLLELTLLKPSTFGEPFRKLLAERDRINLFVSSRDLKNLPEADPESFAALKSACEAGKVQFIADDFCTKSLLAYPLLDAAQKILDGKSVYTTLFSVQPTVFGKLGTGLNPFLPQLLNLCGYKGAIHFAPLDGWKMKEQTQSKMIWKGDDGSRLDALIRYPMNATSHRDFFDLPSRLGHIIDSDHAATAVFARFPGQKSRWLDDLLRMDRFSPALGVFCGIDDYFKSTEHAGTVTQNGFGKYPGNSLSTAVLEGDDDPVSFWAGFYREEHVEKTNRSTIQTLCAVLGVFETEFDKETATLAKAVCGDASENVSVQKPIFLANPWSFPRRVHLDVSDWTELPPEEKPIVLARQKKEHKEIVVDVPPLGYVVVEPPSKSAGTDDDPQPAQRKQPKSFLASLFAKPTARTISKSSKPLIEKVEQKIDAQSTRTLYRLQNEYFEANIDATIGMLRSLFTNEHRHNRLSMQLGYRMPKELRAKDFRNEDDPNRGYAGMAADEIVVEQTGPITGRIRISGRLVCPDGCIAAMFIETLTVRRLSRVIECEVEIDPKMPAGDSPWDSYYGVRLAWNDNTLDVRGGVGNGSHPLTADLLQAPQFVDLRGEKNSLTLLSGGLPFHRKFGERQLDTILIAKGETATRFRFGIGVDLAYPVPASLQFLENPALLVCPAPKIPKRKSSWLFHVDAKNVVALRWEPLVEDGKRSGLRVFLLETEGRRAHFPLRSFLPLRKAEAVDLLGETIKEIKVDGDAALIDMHEHQLLPLVLRFA